MNTSAKLAAKQYLFRQLFHSGSAHAQAGMAKAAVEHKAGPLTQAQRTAWDVCDASLAFGGEGYNPPIYPPPGWNVQTPPQSFPQFKPNRGGFVPAPPPLWVEQGYLYSGGRVEEQQSANVRELVKKAREKNYRIDENFWHRYKSIPEMAAQTKKEDIVEILENFALIHRKHIFLFQRLKATIIAHKDEWHASDLASVCHNWAQLGFLHEDFCVAIAGRVQAGAMECKPSQLVQLLDAYATTRCHVESAVSALSAASLEYVDEFTVEELCLHSSSFARLNLAHEPLFRRMGLRLMNFADQQIEENEHNRLKAEESHIFDTATANLDAHSFPSPDFVPVPLFSARSITLAAYAFSKLKFGWPALFEKLSLLARGVSRDFTAKELQMLVVAFDKAQYIDTELFGLLSMQAQRRIAQFSAESLALFLRSFAQQGIKCDSLMNRVTTQLPRLSASLKSIDLVTLLGSYAKLEVKSEAALDIIAPLVLEKTSQFSPVEWASLVTSFGTLQYECDDVLAVFCDILVNPPTSRKAGILESFSAAQIVEVISSLCSLRYRHDAGLALLGNALVEKVDLASKKGGAPLSLAQAEKLFSSLSILQQARERSGVVQDHSPFLQWTLAQMVENPEVREPFQEQQESIDALLGSEEEGSDGVQCDEGLVLAVVDEALGDGRKMSGNM